MIAFVPRLSPTCFWLWVPWATWFCTCLPLFSHTCRQVAHRLTPTVSKYAAGALGRMSLRLSPVLHLSPSCLSPRLCAGSTVSKLAAWFSAFEERCGCFGPPDSRLSPTCLPMCCRCSGPNDSRCGCFGPHDAALASHLSPSMLWMLWGAWFYTCPPLVPRLSPTVLLYALGSLGRLILHLFPACFPLVSRLSPTVSQHAVGAVGNMTLHLVTGQKI